MYRYYQELHFAILTIHKENHENKIAAIALVFILPFTAHAFSSGDPGDS